MIIEDILLIDKVHASIIEGLDVQSIEYEDYEFIYLIYEDLGIRREQLILHLSNGKSITDRGIGEDHSPDLDYYLRSLFIQMTERGDKWKSMTLKFVGGKVITNFSYEDNPPPW